MLGVHKILVGVDYNSHTGELPLPTRRAVEKAIWLARLIRAEVTLMSVFSEDETATDIQIEGIKAADPQNDVQKQISNYVSDARENDVEIVTKTAIGKGWLELTKEAIKGKHDLVIVGTREQTASQKMIYGSTGLKLLRKCPCPVWITRPDVDPLDANMIVAAVDLTDVGNRILHTSVGVGQLIEARLLVVHAVEYPFEGSLKRTECGQEVIDEYRNKVKSEAESQIQTWLSETDYRTLQQGVQVEISNGPADTIIEQAVNDHQADLLVMGTLARGGIPGFLIGNTAERLLPRLNCSLLAIKPDDFVSPVTVD